MERKCEQELPISLWCWKCADWSAFRALTTLLLLLLLLLLLHPKSFLLQSLTSSSSSVPCLTYPHLVALWPVCKVKDTFRVWRLGSHLICMHACMSNDGAQHAVPLSHIKSPFNHFGSLMTILWCELFVCFIQLLCQLLGNYCCPCEYLNSVPLSITFTDSKWRKQNILHEGAAVLALCFAVTVRFHCTARS